MIILDNANDTDNVTRRHGDRASWGSSLTSECTEPVNKLPSWSIPREDGDGRLQWRKPERLSIPGDTVRRGSDGRLKVVQQADLQLLKRGASAREVATSNI